MNRSTSKLTAIVLAAVLLGGAMTMAVTQAAFAAGDVVTQSVDAPFDKLLTKLKKEIAGHKLVIVKEVPFQKMLGMVGIKADSMVGLEIFHPRYGKVLYQTDQSAFKEAPLRILVMASGDTVNIEYRKPSAVFSSYSGLSGLGEELDGIFADIIARATQ